MKGAWYPGLETFRLLPWPDRPDFFVVYIADDVPTMHLVMAESMGDDANVGVTAACITCTADPVKRPDYAALVGVLFFARDNMGGGTVAHEIAHAGFRACERTRRRTLRWRHGPFRERLSWWTSWLVDILRLHDNVTEQESLEERYCYAVDRMHAQFWREWYSRDLTKA